MRSLIRRVPWATAAALSLCSLLPSAVDAAHSVAVAADHKAIGTECTATAVDPCDTGANATWMVCTKLESQTTKCSVKCAKNSEECNAYGDDLQCLIVETGAETGYCAETSILWIVGISLSLAGSLISNCGMQVQKLAFNKHETEVATTAELPDADPAKIKRKVPFCLPLWVAGFAGMVSGSLLDFLSLVFAAQSLLAPLAASTLVINIVQAPIIVNEKPTPFDIACTMVIATGCVLAVAFADHDTKTYSLQEMLRLWYNPSFIVWLSFVFAAMSCLYLVIRDGNKPAPGQKPISEGGKSKMMVSREQGSNFYPFFFCALGGQSGGNSILFAKALGEICKTTVQVGISFKDLMIAITGAVGLFMCMFIQLKYLNQGLRLFDVLFVLPIYQAFWIFGATVNGILFFEEYNNFTDLQFVMFPVGCILTVTGVAMLSLKFKQSGGTPALGTNGSLAVTSTAPVKNLEGTPPVPDGVTGSTDTNADPDDITLNMDDAQGGARPADLQLVPAESTLEKALSPTTRARRASEDNWRVLYNQDPAIGLAGTILDGPTDAMSKRSPSPAQKGGTAAKP